MNLTVAYRGRSSIVSGPAGLTVALAANLRRDRVGFDAELLHPSRFREALAAFHDIIISNLQSRPRDRSGQRDRVGVRKGDEEFARLDADFRASRRQYWAARDRHDRQNLAGDPELRRALMPCDPVVTVASDVVIFEGFAADGASYASLTVDRKAFSGETSVNLGTTNVDFARTLLDRVQLLRNQTRTQFRIHPPEFEVAATGPWDGYREEQIELPDPWLRSFLQIQSALSLPTRRVSLGREGLYNVLAFLGRHRAARGPRAIRFDLNPGRPPALVLEPWDERIVLHDRPYEGPKAESIRVWGRDRLRAFARLLPDLDGAEVDLLGNGLPSFWSVRTGPIRLLLGLSGRPAHDRAGGSNLARLAPPVEPSRYLANRVAASFRSDPGQTLAEVVARSGGPEAEVVAVLYQLAGLGQVIHDLHAGRYRWRSLMPVAVSADRLGPEDPETVAAREIARTSAVRVVVDEPRPDGSRTLAGTVVEAARLDAPGRRRPDDSGPLHMLGSSQIRDSPRSLPPPPGPPREGRRPRRCSVEPDVLARFAPGLIPRARSIHP